MKSVNIFLFTCFFIGSQLFATDQLNDEKSQDLPIMNNLHAKNVQLLEQRKYAQEVAIISAGASATGLVYCVYFTNDRATQVMTIGSAAISGIALAFDHILKSQQK